MTQAQISREDIAAVLPTVSATIADALGCDVEEVTPDASLIDDLDAESIDFLDMVFRLERAFKVKIPRGKIVENARGTLTEAEFEQNGIVTDVGLTQLKEYLSEVPADRFKTPTKVKDIPRLFTTTTFAKLVIAAQRETNEPPRVAALGGGASALRAAVRALTLGVRVRMADHFAAFSFVDRITEYEPGRRARGRYVVPARHRGVSVVPRRRSRRAARGVGLDGAHRLSRPAGGRARERDAIPRRRPARQHARARRRHRKLRRARGRLRRPGVVDGTEVDRARRLPRPDAAGRRVRLAGRDGGALRAHPRRGRAARPLPRRRRAARRAHRGRARRVGERHAFGTGVGAVLRRSLPAPSGLSGNAAARCADPLRARSSRPRRRTGLRERGRRRPA